jgi:hypothetical protein
MCFSLARKNRIAHEKSENAGILNRLLGLFSGKAANRVMQSYAGKKAVSGNTD